MFMHETSEFLHYALQLVTQYFRLTLKISSRR